MWIWIAALGGILSGLLALSAALARRWGRGAYETTYQRPDNEVQTTTPWKSWPL